MRLSDKNIELILEDSRECRAPGMGDVQLLCAEIQERRKNGENVPTALLGDRLLERFQEGSNISDSTAAALIAYLQGKPHKRKWEVPEEVTNATLMDELIKRIGDKEGFLDRHIISFINQLKACGYFQTWLPVDMQALKQLLYALSAPDQPHLLREMQVTRGLPVVEGEPRNPIDQLIVDMQAVKNASA